MNQNNIIIKEVFQQALIQSSSDLIVTLYQTLLKIDFPKSLILDPIVRWEFNNYHDEWSKNIYFIQEKLHDLDDEDYTEIFDAYTFAADFLLTNEAMCRVFRIDDKDVIGWKILKELREKRDLTEKMQKIAQYNRSKV